MMDTKEVGKYRDFLLFLIFVIVLTALTPLIEKFFLEHLVHNTMDQVKSTFFLDFILIVAVIIYSALQMNFCNSVKPKATMTFVLLLLTGLYTYERAFNDFFTFITFRLSSSIAYLDTIFLVLMFHLGGYLKFLQTKKTIQKHNQLFEDAPISDPVDDKLDGLFDLASKKIAKIISKNSFETSFTIGLNGEWGDGKTSVLNFVKNNIEGENTIVFDFNPWMGYDKKVLIKDFFNSFSDALGRDLSDDFSIYSEELLDNGNSLTFYRFFRNIFYRKQSIQTIFEKLNEKIGLVNKKIIVFIDDVDRLDKEEIFELLKLIRKTANFKNTFFVLAYDRNYVNESIKGQSAESTIKYLDKIINVEINLPYFEKNTLKDYFQESLREVLPANVSFKIDNFLRSYEQDPTIWDLGFKENDLFLFWLNNFREIKKVINSIIVNYEGIYLNLNFLDVVHLEILRLKHPYLYRLLFTKKDELFKEDTNTGVYYFRPIDETKAAAKQFAKFLERNNKSGMDSSEKEITVLDYYLSEYVEINCIDDIEKEKINDLIHRLFPRYENNSFSYDVDSKILEGELSVRYATKFERYFSQTIFRNNIDEKTFLDFIEGDSMQIDSQIHKWIEEKKIKDLSTRLNKITHFKNGKAYENTIKASLEILGKDVKGNLIDFQKLSYKLMEWEDVAKFYSNVTDGKNFLISVFEEDSGNIQSKANLLHDLKLKNRRRGETMNKFPLTEEEIYGIQKGYLLKFIGEETEFTEGFWNLYFKNVKQKDDGEKYVDADINEKVKSILNSCNSKENFLLSLINNVGYYETSIKKEGIKLLFGKSEDFEDFFFREICSDIVEEFADFYEKVKGNSWNSVDFQFSHIKLPHD